MGNTRAIRVPTNSSDLTKKFEAKMLRTFFTFGLLVAPNLAGPLEEAPYTVVAEHEGWQERDYPQTRWVSTDFVDIFAHDGSQHMEAFNKLFQFISGKNSDSVEIPMTAPVTFRIIPGEGPNCSSSVTMSFLVPSFLQEVTPEPLDTSVYLEDRPAMRLLPESLMDFLMNWIGPCRQRSCLSLPPRLDCSPGRSHTGLRDTTGQALLSTGETKCGWRWKTPTLLLEKAQIGSFALQLFLASGNS